MNAVPSFQPEWQRWLTDQADYVARFPDEVLSPPELTHVFFDRLAGHVGVRIAAGDLGEAGRLFATLEQIYDRADTELTAKLTVGFLESLILAIESAGGDARIVEQVHKGPISSRGWSLAYEYIHPPDEV